MLPVSDATTNRSDEALSSLAVPPACVNAPADLDAESPAGAPAGVDPLSATPAPTEQGEWTKLQRSAVLVVDDDYGVRNTVSRFLQREGYEVLAAENLTEARDHLHNHDILVVLADITLKGGENGLEFLHEVRAARPNLDVMMMTAHSDLDYAVEALKQGAYDYLTKPFPFELLKAAVNRAVERRRYVEREAMLDLLEERRATDEENVEQFMVSLASITDAKSHFTARHSARVADLSRLLAEAMGLDDDTIARVTLGGRLHDIGKIGVSEMIIEKAGPLTRDEFEIMKRHPSIGDDLLAPIRTMQELRPMVRWHHESLDGTGYPDGLKGDLIPVEAMIVKVADIWEAITSRRPYREPMSLEVAAKTLAAEAGRRVPADMVDAFLQAIEGAPIALPIVAA